MEKMLLKSHPLVWWKHTGVIAKMIPLHNIILIFSRYVMFVQGALEDPAQSSDSCLLLLSSHSRVMEPT